MQPVHREESLCQDVSVHVASTDLSNTSTGKQECQIELDAARWASDSIMICKVNEMLKQEINRSHHSKTSSINESKPMEVEKEREVKKTQYPLRSFSFNTNDKLNCSQTSKRESEVNSNGQGLSHLQLI